MMQVGHPRHAGRVAATTPPAGMLTARTRTHRTRTRTRRSSAATGYGQHVARNRLRTLRRGDQVITWTARIRHAPGSGDCHRGIRVRAMGAGKRNGGRSGPDDTVVERSALGGDAQRLTGA
jgi:hypothetical protein